MPDNKLKPTASTFEWILFYCVLLIVFYVLAHLIIGTKLNSLLVNGTARPSELSKTENKFKLTYLENPSLELMSTDSSNIIVRLTGVIFKDTLEFAGTFSKESYSTMKDMTTNNKILTSVTGRYDPIINKLENVKTHRRANLVYGLTYKWIAPLSSDYIKALKMSVRMIVLLIDILIILIIIALSSSSRITDKHVQDGKKIIDATGDAIETKDYLKDIIEDLR